MKVLGDVSEDQFLDVCMRNPMIREVLVRVEQLGLSDWWLVAGCLQQTVWNVLDGQRPDRGISDYDVIYFDDSDLSWQAEDAVIRECGRVCSELAVTVEVRNQARVHLWYEEHFGVSTGPVRSSRDSIDRHACHAGQLAIRSNGGQLEVYAPNGFDDVFNFLIRPNPGVAPKSVYEAKTARWQELWPQLRVVPWPS